MMNRIASKTRMCVRGGGRVLSSPSRLVGRFVFHRGDIVSERLYRCVYSGVGRCHADVGRRVYIYIHVYIHTFAIIRERIRLLIHFEFIRLIISAPIACETDAASLSLIKNFTRFH